MSEKEHAPEIDAREYVESWIETLEILTDPEAMAMIRQAQKEFRAGLYYSLEEVKKEIGL